MSSSLTSSQANRKATKFRIVFLGDQGVGKSAIIERYSLDKFDDGMNATVGIDFSLKNVTRNGQSFMLQIWDTAGQERYRSLIPTYLKNAQCVVFVADLTKNSSLENIRNWYNMFVENQQAPGFLVGNKSDLTPARKVSRQVIQSIAKELKLAYYEVSAKQNRNIQELFNNILTTILLEKKTTNIEVTETRLKHEELSKIEQKSVKVKLQATKELVAGKCCKDA